MGTYSQQRSQQGGFSIWLVVIVRLITISSNNQTKIQRLLHRLFDSRRESASNFLCPRRLQTHLFLQIHQFLTVDLKPHFQFPAIFVLSEIFLFDLVFGVNYLAKSRSRRYFLAKRRHLAIYFLLFPGLGVFHLIF